ncbi:MAG: PAS domain S-box protein [Acidobacteriota bacterium]
MQWVVILSFALRAAAAVWALLLLHRWRDRRALVTAGLLVFLVTHPGLALQAYRGAGPRAIEIEPLSLMISLLIFPTVYLLERNRTGTEAMFRKAFRASPDAVTVTTLNDGRFIEINESFEQITGYSRAETVGRTSADLELWVYPEDRDRLRAAIDGEGTVTNRELTFRRKSGEHMLCLVSADVVEFEGRSRLLMTVRDITEYRRAEEALRVSEANFAAATRASPDAMVISSLGDGKILVANEGFYRVTGHRPEEAVGHRASELGLWVDPSVRDELIQKLRSEGQVQELESQLRTKSGEIRDGVMSATVIEIEGRPSLLSIVRDITERKRTEAERATMFRELEAKNEELERYAYTLSHDLKSPLVTIRGFLGLLQRDLAAGNTERAERDLARIDGAAATMSRLVDELLELSRIGRVVHAYESVSGVELAEEAARLVAGQLQERDVQIEIAPDLPTLFGDRVRLLEVLQNLIDNAVKFLGEQ